MKGTRKKHAGELIFDPVDGGSTFLRNVSNPVPEYTVS
jgi:hypothetical protein